MTIPTLLPLALAFGLLGQTPQEGLAAKGSGDIPRAVRIFEGLAEKGDAKAMTTLGLWYQQGDGVEQDYGRAHSWFVKALAKDDGDAWNNLGVMRRDGLGVAQNKQLAWASFMLVHLAGLGSESTQYRAGSNLERLGPELTKVQVDEALGWTVDYIRASLTGRGPLKPVSDELKPGPGRPTLRELA